MVLHMLLLGHFLQLEVAKKVHVMSNLTEFNIQAYKWIYKEAGTTALSLF